MNIAIIYTTNANYTKISCRVLYEKINADVQIVPIEMAKSECILKYNFIILAGSALKGKVQSGLKMYISKNMKTLKEKPLALVINCEKDKDRYNKTFTEELVNSSYIHSNFGYELNPNEGSYIEKRKINKLINKYKREGKEFPKLNYDEIDNFADNINKMIEKRVG